MNRLRKIFDWTIGLTLILCGVLSGFVPFLPGWVLILAGLAVLSSHSKLAHALNERFKAVGRRVRDRIVTRPPGGADRDNPPE